MLQLPIPNVTAKTQLLSPFPHSPSTMSTQQVCSPLFTGNPHNIQETSSALSYTIKPLSCIQTGYSHTLDRVYSFQVVMIIDPVN